MKISLTTYVSDTGESFTRAVPPGDEPRAVILIGDTPYVRKLVQSFDDDAAEWKARALTAERNELEMATTLSKAIGKLASMQAELDNAHAIIDGNDTEALRMALELQAESILAPAVEPSALRSIFAPPAFPSVRKGAA